MPQKTHIMHGRDHEPHGADPIRGLIPAGDTLDERILALGPVGFWKLNETSGSVAHDSSGQDNHLSTTSPEVDPLWGQDEGPPGEPTADFQNGTSGGSGTASRVSSAWPEINHSFTAAIWVNRNDTAFTFVMGQGLPERTGDGWQLAITATDVPEPARSQRPVADMNGVPDLVEVAAMNQLGVDEWVQLAIVYDADTTRFKLYVDGLLNGTSEPFTFASDDTELWIGHDGYSSVLVGRFKGSYAFLVNRALSGAELLEIVEGVEGGGGGVVVVGPGGEITVDPTPGIDIEHGDGEEEEDPITGPGAGGAANGSGWHYADHFEYVVLYDSNPGRFDVPSRKWVRVPFNTVRIQRRWETEPGLFKDAWLPDDRGLGEHAKQGLLLVTAGMTFGSDNQEISGWFSIEYPALDSSALPNPGGGSPDRYVRAARMTNATNGSVLRVGGSVDLSYRNFFEWPFSTPAGGDEGRIYFQADNPYPLYPNSPGRPLNKPLPYPKLTSAESLNKYQLESGIEGFGLGYFTSLLNLDAGAAISLQAWQDSPWPLRFGTDKYPPFTAQNYRETWRKRPALVLYHRYDPDTVDHDTGLLL